MKIDINITNDLTEEITPEQDARWQQIYEHLTEVIKLIYETDDTGEIFGLLCSSIIMLFGIDPDDDKLTSEIELTVIKLIKIIKMEGK